MKQASLDFGAVLLNMPKKEGQNLHVRKIFFIFALHLRQHDDMNSIYTYLYITTLKQLLKHGRQQKPAGGAAVPA